MAITKNDLDIYYAVGDCNTSRQETEIGEIIKKRNSLGCKLVFTTMIDVDKINHSGELISVSGEKI